ncbi:MAG TPA: SigE family RNA polymerase sigma factor [Marmoricola sp.]
MTRGPDGSFDEFVRGRLPQLLAFARALTGSEHAAADLVQDALERCLPRWSKIATGNPDAYVRRVMVNRNISVWRLRRRESLTDVTPEVGYVDQSTDLDLWRAISRLPARQRAVVALRYYEDLSEAEIARVLGCSTGTVKSQASRALGKLHNLLTQEETPSGGRR